MDVVKMSVLLLIRLNCKLQTKLVLTSVGENILNDIMQELGIFKTCNQRRNIVFLSIN